jgi:hypothetical protein
MYGVLCFFRHAPVQKMSLTVHTHCGYRMIKIHVSRYWYKYNFFTIYRWAEMGFNKINRHTNCDKRSLQWRLWLDTVTLLSGPVTKMMACVRVFDYVQWRTVTPCTDYTEGVDLDLSMYLANSPVPYCTHSSSVPHCTYSSPVPAVHRSSVPHCTYSLMMARSFSRRM